MPSFHSLRVADIRKETPDTVSISFDVPDALQPKFRFQNGQYVTLKLNLDGEVRRSYSLSSCLTTDSEHRIAVKEVENGLVSGYLNRELKVGDMLDVSEPEGRFCPTLEASQVRQYVLFAAGSGITPIYSIIKGVLATEPGSKVILLYQNRDEDTIIFGEELHALAAREPRFEMHIVYSQPKDSYDSLHVGRMDPKKAIALLREHVQVSLESEYYLCGPEGFMMAGKQALENLRVDPNTVHMEYFTTSSAEPAEAPVAGGEITGPVAATIMLDDESHEITIDKGITILDAALSAGLDAPYSCRGGVCSSCMAKLEKGTATMRLNYTLTDDEVAEGYILTCQADPTAPELTVDFDA